MEIQRMGSIAPQVQKVEFTAPNIHHCATVEEVAAVVVQLGVLH